MLRKQQFLSALLGLVCLGAIFLDFESTGLRRLETATGKSSSNETQNATNETDCLTPEMNGTWKLLTAEQKVANNSTFCCGMRWGHAKEHPDECGPGRHKRLPHDDFQANIKATGKQFFHHFDVPACQLCEKAGFQERYHWESDALPSKFDADSFCNNILGRKLLMIGDSTMSQASGVLMNALMGTECAKNITFGMSDTLIGETMGRYNRGRKWDDLLEVYNPDIVVVSSGAHIFGEKNFDRVFETVLKELEEVKKKRPGLEFIWKTQSAGGPCTDDIASLTDHPFSVARQLDWTGHTFQHDTFFDRDRRVIEQLQKRGIPFIDMRMTYSRTDAHLGGGDCLHFCLEPGPLEVFPRLLHKVLENKEKPSQCIETQ